MAAVDLPRALKDFHARHPQVKVTLRVGASEELTERVRQGDMDVAFLGLPLGMSPKGVRSRELARGELVAVVPAGHQLADEVGVDLRRLAQEVFVDFPEGTAGRAQSDEAFAAAGLTREVAFEVTAADFMARLIRQGLGIAMLPAAFVGETTELRMLRVMDAPARMEHLIWSLHRPSPAAAAFLAGLTGGRPETG
ncbi:LysR substrate-binding domain-containing protein [Nonomuraea dietziae]|uniref:LysR substrate-binding domain-containing protein n=1 Tax=Nonomuraea dietziae TaxID=65515 RepID=UPI00361FE27F